MWTRWGRLLYGVNYDHLCCSCCLILYYYYLHRHNHYYNSLMEPLCGKYRASIDGTAERRICSTSLLLLSNRLHRMRRLESAFFVLQGKRSSHRLPHPACSECSWFRSPVLQWGYRLFIWVACVFIRITCSSFGSSVLHWVRSPILHWSHLFFVMVSHSSCAMCPH